MKDTVTGLELFAVHGRYGKYLQCDLCGTTLDAPRANVGTEKERIGCDAEALLRLAVNEGWECSDKGHVCSECLHQRSDEEISAFMNSLKPAEARKTCAARGFMFGNDEAKLNARIAELEAQQAVLVEALTEYMAAYNEHWERGMPILEPMGDAALAAVKPAGQKGSETWKQ